MSKCAGCGKSFPHFLCNDPDRCQLCGEASNNRAVLGSIKCRCMQPSQPRCGSPSFHAKGCICAMEAAERKPLSGKVRYGN